MLFDEGHKGHLKIQQSAKYTLWKTHGRSAVTRNKTKNIRKP